MGLPTMVLIALGLAMDAFAVSISSGLTIRDCGVRHATLIASFFGGFQALMPVVGWLAGLTLRSYIMAWDHWLAFSLLAFIGGKMIYESTVMEEEDRCTTLSFHLLLGLSVATSIDALAVGVTFAFLDVLILTPVLIIGAVTFALSYVGVLVGKRLGHFFERRIEVVGGLVLIGIGLKILIEHLVKEGL